MSVTQVSKLFIVELHTRGWAVGISHTPEERVITTIFRLSKQQKNKLQSLKVRFYRVLERYSTFTLGEKYIVPQKYLPNIEGEFKNIHNEFITLRKEIYSELMQKWDEIKKRLETYAKKMGLNVNIERLKPVGEDFLEMYYIVTPLNLSINQLIDLSKEFETLAKERDEYKSLANRLKGEANRMINEIKAKYEEKINELESTVNKLKEALKEKSREVYRLRLRVKEVADDAEEIANFLGEETVEDLKNRLEALKEVFTTQTSGG